MKSFSRILKRAAKRKGGEAVLKSMLPEVTDPGDLARRPDAFFLANMTKRIFQAGFVWRVIEAKWPGFEQAFFDFDPARLMALSETEWEAYGRDERIVRNLQKVYALRHNVYYVNETAAEYGSYGEYLAGWPSDNLVGLLDEMKKRGKRLGGMTGTFFLATVGKDCYLTTPDVVLCLQQEGLDIPDNPTGKKHRQQIQDAFNYWHSETGMPYRHLSMIMANSVGVNRPVEATAD